MKKSKSFFHALKATLDRLADRLSCTPSASAIPPDALPEHDQPQVSWISGKELSAFHRRMNSSMRSRSLGRWLMQAGGNILISVIAVQRILRLMPGEPPLVGHFVPGIGHKYFGYSLSETSIN